MIWVYSPLRCIYPLTPLPPFFTFIFRFGFRLFRSFPTPRSITTPVYVSLPVYCCCFYCTFIAFYFAGLLRYVYCVFGFCLRSSFLLRFIFSVTIACLPLHALPPRSFFFLPSSSSCTFLFILPLFIYFTTTPCACTLRTRHLWFLPFAFLCVTFTFTFYTPVLLRVYACVYFMLCVRAALPHTPSFLRRCRVFTLPYFTFTFPLRSVYVRLCALRLLPPCICPLPPLRLYVWFLRLPHGSIYFGLHF